MLIARDRELEALGAAAALRSVANERGERIREVPAPLVVVYGGASTGKSACVAQALRTGADLSALVDCTAVYSAPELYREVLAQLHSGASGGGTGANVGAGEAIAELTIDGAPEEQQGVSDAGASDDSDSNDDGDDNGGGDDDADEDTNTGVLSAGARTKRARALQRRRQQQRDADAARGRVRFEGDGALNFLGFVKALDNFVAIAAAAAASAQQPCKRVLHVALDQADKLLDRGLAPLLTCLFTINEQLAYLNMFSAATWDVSVILVTRAMSLEFDRLVAPFFPACILFPPYTNEQVADILVEQLGMQPLARAFRRWLLHLSALAPASQGDWLEFRRTVVHLLPDFRAFFAAPPPATDKQMRKLLRATTECASAFERSRRRHLFGHDKLQRSGGGGDPTADAIASGGLSRSCLLLVVAGFLASFNPQDADTHFLSSSGGVRRVKRAKRNAGQPSAAAAAEHVSQLLIGPRIFTLQRLLAIYLNLRAEATADLSDEFVVTEAREDIFTHLATLVRMQLFQRTSPPNTLDDIKFRCLADSRFVHETARFLHFPLESYLNTAS